MGKLASFGRYLLDQFDWMCRGVGVWIAITLLGGILSQLIFAPVWVVLVSAAIGLVLFAIAERKVFGYRLIIALAVITPGGRLGGHDLHLNQISVLVIVLAFLAMYARKGWPQGSNRNLATAS